MLTRSSLAIGASVLAAIAAVISSLDGDDFMVPFFSGLAVLGAIGAWVVREPYTGSRRMVAAGMSTLWLGAAGVIGALLIWERAMCGCSSPPPMAEATYLGLTATVYHVAAVYLGGALMAVAAFSRQLAEA
jgi:hypothetical protein